MLLPLLGSNVNTPFNLNRPSEKQQEHCWLEQNAFLCHINPVWHHSEQVKMPKAATGPLLLPPECWWEPTTCYILTDSIFQCKWGLEKNSEPSRGKAAPKAPCRGAQTTQAEPSALLSKNRHKCSARRHKKHFTRGAVTSSLLFISLCNDFMLRLQGLFFSPSLCLGPCGFYRNVHIKQWLAALYNHPGMQWVSHGALLNTAVHRPSWTINIWSMANVLWARRFVISVNTKGLLKWPNDFSFTSGVLKVMKLENTEVENQDVAFMLFKQWEFI